MYLNAQKNFKHKSSILKEGKNEVKKLIAEIENFTTNPINDITTKIHRKIKNINIYKLDYINGSLKKVFRRTDIEGFKKFFRLSNNKLNKIVGFTPDYVGIIPSKPVNFNNIFIKFMNSNFGEFRHKLPELASEYIKSINSFREVFTGSYDSNSLHLREFMKDNTTKITAVEIIEKLKDNPWLQSPHLNFDDFDNSKFYINYNPKSSPGHYTSKLFHCTSKGYSIPYAFELARKKMELIQNFPIKNFTLWTVNAREKDVKTHEFDYDKGASTRVVLNTEHYEILILSYFFQKLVKSIDSFSKNKKFNLAGEYDGSKALKLYEKARDYKYVVDADWTFFDASIDTEYLKAAGAIMFSNSNIGDKKQLRSIFHVISSFVTKYILVPPGIVIELNRGNPSGHPGVTAINCFVNLIRWSLIGFEIYGPEFYKYMDIEVYGDDALVFFKEHTNLSNIDTIINDLGFKSESIYDKLYPTEFFGVYNNEGPDFLKRRFINGGLVWNYKKMFDKLNFQSKKRSVYDQIDLVCNYYYTAPTDPDLRKFCILFLNWALKEFKNDVKVIANVNKNLQLIEEYDVSRFFGNVKYEKLYHAEFKVTHKRTAMLRSTFDSSRSKKKLTVDQLEIMRLLFCLNEYVSHPYRISQMKSEALKKKLLVIYTNFKNIKKTYLKVRGFDSS